MSGAISTGDGISMVEFNPASVTITGGTINGTTIGGTTPAAITGTTITATTAFAADDVTTAKLSAANLGLLHVNYHSGVPASVGAVTTEAILGTCTITMPEVGPNGFFEVVALFSYSNDGFTKTGRLRLGGIGGTTLKSIAATTTASFELCAMVSARNSNSSQVTSTSGIPTFGHTATSGVPVTPAIDLSTTFTVVATGQKSDATATVTLERLMCRTYYGA